jgi:hypothetical protein
MSILSVSDDYMSCCQVVALVGTRAKPVSGRGHEEEELDLAVQSVYQSDYRPARHEHVFINKWSCN